MALKKEFDLGFRVTEKKKKNIIELYRLESLELADPGDIPIENINFECNFLSQFFFFIKKNQKHSDANISKKCIIFYLKHTKVEKPFELPFEYSFSRFNLRRKKNIKNNENWTLKFNNIFCRVYENLMKCVVRIGKIRRESSDLLHKILIIIFVENKYSFEKQKCWIIVDSTAEGGSPISNGS